MSLTKLFVAGVLSMLISALQAADATLEQRLQVLEDKEAIRTLLIDYGRFVDDRNWEAFADLFATQGGTWNGGMGVATGREAIIEMMRTTIEATNRNAAGNGYSNLHLLGNEQIDVDGDHATALSKWVFVMTGADNGPDVTFIGRYQDRFVRENGSWKFQERIVHGDIAKPVNIPGLDRGGN